MALKADPPEVMMLIHDGMSVAQLSQAFHMDAAKVRKLVRDVKPSERKKGGNVDLYPLKEAARYLVEPVIDEETFIRSITRTQDIPPFLQKEYWAALLNKQRYLLQEGDLWPTDDVLAVLAEVFKKLKTGIQLFSDTIESRTELTQKQRQIIDELADGLCLELRRILVEGQFEREHTSEREAVISDAN